ncbi:flagellar biosynthesis protein FlhF [Aestuariibacter sp. AA17]|uniref:Flagellar biosynthesis protein FlhF n=1 Tax=Fluctibacter corallii TaxID=2984329 RepID=A0ABT3A3C8_9ALTE|nr:flagellar biosynthesis protein FlhF [Aestuariibacter sp. AA17]MCV2883188.1 flagellar biosynthesis protein FlhF [Aestuariibacter sp. AA17]
MKIKRFIGRDMREALKMVKDELGGDAVIMSNKKVPEGIELVAAYEQAPAAPLSSMSPAGAVTDTPPAAAKPTPTLSEIIGDSGPDSLRALLEQQSKSRAEKADATQPSTSYAKSPPNASHASHASAQQNREAYEPTRTAQLHRQPDVSQKAAQSTPQDAQLMRDIRNELKSLRNVLQFQVSGLFEQEKKRAHPLHDYLSSRLTEMGIDTQLANEVVSYAPEKSDERQAWLFLLKLLANRISTTGNSILSEKGVVALVGPTGTGKTTTISKLAARYAQKYGANQVAMVTIDSYRIAAYEQLATYGKIIGCTVKRAQNKEELEDVLYQLRNKRLVLIDTAGFSQRDSRLINQLDTLNHQSCANIKKYLIMQANSQYQVMERTIESYKSISLHGCIFTKLDECYSLGEAISAAINHRLAVSYVTDGQRVPEDIKVADAKFLITAAAKLYKKYGLTHTVDQQNSNPAIAV